MARLSASCQMRVAHPLGFGGRVNSATSARHEDTQCDPSAPPPLSLPQPPFSAGSLLFVIAEASEQRPLCNFYFSWKKLWRTGVWVGLETFSIYSLYVLDSKTLGRNRFLMAWDVECILQWLPGGICPFPSRTVSYAVCHCARACLVLHGR